VWIFDKFPRTSITSFFTFYSFLNIILLFYKNNNYCPPDQKSNFIKKSNIYLKNIGMQQESIYTVLITIITVLGSASAWRFYEKKSMRKERDEEFIRHDCKDRISKLEALLENSSKEKDEMRSTILKLTEQVAALAVKVEYLQKENSDLYKTLNKSSL
jgi:hypothetical protein